MRLVFFGYGELGAVVLDALVDHHEIVQVVTHPTDFAGLGEPHVAERAQRHGQRMYVTSDGGDAELTRIVGDADADVIVSTNWRTKLPVDLLATPRLGGLNVHDALLPSYSGFGAVNWAIRNGEHETGATVHLMAEEFDSGPVLVQRRVPIGPNDTAAEVYRAVTAQYAPATLAALHALASGERGQPQDGTARTFYHRIGESDTRIDWSRPTSRVHDLVRGQSDPYPNAWTTLEGTKLAVKRAALPDIGYCGTPGRVVTHTRRGVAIACGEPGTTDARGIVLLDVALGDDPPRPAREVLRRAGGLLV